MKFTVSWLKDYLDTEASLDEIVDTLNRIGLEVEDVTNPADKLRPFLVAEVLDAKPHPDADKLKVCTVDAGSGPVQIVCGAHNARAGMKAVLARPGDYVPGIDVTLKAAKIRGVESKGMMCSARELELGDDHDGIIDLPAEAPVGVSYAEYSGLDDPCIEIAITPNRQDCLGIYGIARDLSAAGLGSLKAIDTSEITPGFETSFSPEIETEDCSLFLARVFRGVKNGPSPVWLVKKLQSVGLRSISTLVDITNYITVTYGRPLHVYDAGALSGNLVARSAKKGEQFKALDDITYTATGGEVIIADDKTVHGFGGIIGASVSGVDENTTDVVLEVALFDLVRTAMTGRSHDIITDARYRFERGVDPLFARQGMALATSMILDLCGGEVSQVKQAGPDPVFDKKVAFNTRRVETLGGLKVSDKECARILSSLGFVVDQLSVPWMVGVPSWRVDVDGEADLVEEVLRIHGYDEIPSVPLPATDHRAGDTLSRRQKRARSVRRQLASRGMHEAVTWSFMRRDHACLFGSDRDDLVIDNPISSELGYMRPSILPNLMMAAQKNRDRGALSVAIFEVGPIYENDQNDGQLLVAGLLRAYAKGTRNWSDTAGNVSVFDVKADALAALSAAGAPAGNLMVFEEAPKHFHPGRSGTLRLGPKVILASFGEINPQILTSMDVDGPMVGAEIYLDRIPARKRKTAAKEVLSISNLQKVERDFAFIVTAETQAQLLIKAIRGADKTVISNVVLFDVYEGPGVDEGHKSVAISVSLTPKDRTFTEADLEALSQKIIQAADKAVGATLRI